MKINEIFYSIQGEGSTIGQPVLFVRMSGCNQKCWFCFGVKKGRGKIPRISLLHGDGKSAKKRIDKIEKGDVLLTYDKKQNIVETTVTNTIKRTVNQWIEIKINNQLYYVTPEHPFFTTIGLIEAKNLKIGDYIFEMTQYQKSKYRMKKNNPMFQENIKEKSIENTDYKKIGEKISETVQKKKDDGTYISAWNLTNHETQKEIRKKASKRQMGEKNTNWKGGCEKYPIWEILKRNCQKKLPGFIYCSICNQEKKLEIHHLDGNHNNDTYKNMITICHKCHSQIHKRGYNFWNGNRIDNKENLKAAMNHNGKRVDSIKKIDITNKKQYPYPSTTPKPIDVYNISCAPYNTYIADDMWVHNCDTKYHETINEKLNERSILEAVHENNIRKIVFTGGEPLLQQTKITDFLIKYWKYLFNIKIEFETNGTLSISHNLKKIMKQNLYKFHFNVSPKLLSAKNKIIYKNNFIIWRYQNLDEPHSAIFKFVYIEGKEEEILNFIKFHNINETQVYIMPEGDDKNKQEKSMKSVIEFCKKYRFNFSPRLHILIWDKEQGK